MTETGPTPPAGDTAARRILARASQLGWKTTDADEIERRLARAATEPMEVANLEPAEPFYSSFIVYSQGSGMKYRVEIRSLSARQNSCTCVDFRVNGLGTCKHIDEETARRLLDAGAKIVEKARARLAQEALRA